MIQLGSGSIERRAALRLAGLALLAAPFTVEAQPARPGYRIGFLGGASAPGYATLVEALRLGLRDHGYVEGQNITIEYRWAEGKYERHLRFSDVTTGAKTVVEK